MRGAQGFEFGPMRLALEVAFWRLGWRLPATLAAAGVCLAVWLVWVPVQMRRAAQADAQLQEARALVRQGAPREVLEPPLVAFKRLLGAQEDSTAALRQIFAQAAQAGLSVAQVDVRRQVDAAGIYSQLQISLPVHGAYPAIKRFCAGLLQSMPALSIDQILLKREQLASNQVDAQLSLSLWQRPATDGQGARAVAVRKAP